MTEYIPVDLNALGDIPNLSEDITDTLTLFSPKVVENSIKALNLSFSLPQEKSFSVEESKEADDGCINPMLNLRTRGVPSNKHKQTTKSESLSKENFSSSESMSDDDKSCLSSEAYVPSDSNKKKTRKQRWGEAEDRVLFSTIQKLQSQRKLDIDFLDKLSHPRIQHQLEYLAMKVNWVNCINSLKHRITGVLKNSNKMSVRESKLLRKIILNEYVNRPINYEKICYYFP